MQKGLSELAKRRPESIFAAIYSLPELNPLFLSVVGEDREEPWSSRPPAVFSKKIGREAKKELLARVAAFLSGLDPDSRGRAMHTLASWCDADGLLQFAMTKCASHQKKFEAIFSIAATRAIFDPLPAEKRSSAATIGESLSQAERARYHMEALNVISQMTERGQLAYFSELFALWSERESAASDRR
jgi:hypothetical protein